MSIMAPMRARLGKTDDRIAGMAIADGSRSSARHRKQRAALGTNICLSGIVYQACFVSAVALAIKLRAQGSGQTIVRHHSVAAAP